MAWGDIPEWAYDASKNIMQAVNVKDPETFFHCVRVSRNARLLSEAAGLNEYEAKIVEFAGLFHDAGKVAVPDSILLKPAKLTPEEFRIMQSHPVKSAQLLEPLRQIDFFKALIPGVLHHHERVDGRGYPYGLEGDKIPLEARIILIVDTFDAMTATRAYRKGLAPEVAFQELQDFSGRQFDPHLVKIFLKAKSLWTEREESIEQEMQETVFKNAA
ncbi:MAG: HD-GYP domain-containing protein [Bdellovibrionaceae bacterium]|nr:HD-GYP domain-containing protein [Pseudobdellovibrionaceae bacterium]